jgi:hypothetical protein
VVAPSAAGAKTTPPTVAPKVTVRVEGLTKTLLAAKAVRVPTSGWITKGATPKGACPAHSGAGAFNNATRGRWTGKYYQGIGIFITSVFGVKPSNPNDYWTVFVNNRTANAGICDIKPRRGEQLLFAITDGEQLPLVLRAPSQARVGRAITVTAGYYGKSGFTPAAGVHVRTNTVNLVTDKHGQVHISINHTGTLVVHGYGKGYVRAAAVRVRELP